MDHTKHNDIEDLTSVDYSNQLSLHYQPLTDKFRFQLPVTLALASLIEVLVVLLISPDLLSTALFINSLAISFAANLISLLNYRRLRLFPGSRRFAFLIPAFLPGWLFAIFALLWLRIPYSVLLLGFGFSSAIAICWLLSALNRRPKLSPFLLVPGSRIESLRAELPRMHFRICVMPDEIVGPNAVIADLREDLSPEWEKAIALAVLSGATVYHVTHVRESLTGRVKIDHISENSFGTLGPPSLFFFAKGIADRLIGLIGIVITAPIILIAGLVVTLESSGGPLFKQRRVGYRGQEFTIYKLRTMKFSAAPETVVSAMTQAGDQRITKIGSFLRATRIDELPQFLNMCRGELSLIGPRPEASTLSNWYGERVDFYSYRHVVKPGITGWAQVNQGHVTDEKSVARKLEYDFYYIKNFSLWLDLNIIMRTAYVILTGHGAK